MYQINLGDPGQGTAPFPLPAFMAQPSLLIVNESPYGLYFYFGGQPYLVPAESYRQIDSRYIETSTIRWEVAYQLSVGNSPISLCVVECYDCGEQPQASIWALPRQTNIGNGVSVASQASEVINDGNAAPVKVVEATVSGGSSSSLLFYNDGSGAFSGGKITFDAAGNFTSLGAGAVPAAAVAAGALGGGVQLGGAMVARDDATNGFYGPSPAQTPTNSSRGFNVAVWNGGNMSYIPLLDGNGTWLATIPASTVSGAVSSAGSLNQQVTSGDNGTALLYSTVTGRGIALCYKDSGGTLHETVTVNGDGTITLASGAIVPAANVGSGYPVADLAGGTLPSGITVPASQLSGSVPSATNATNATNANNVANGNGTAASAAYGGSGTAHMYLSLAAGGGVAGLNHISGSGSATISHGLSLTPLAALVNTNNGSSSTTYGSGSYTSTSVYIYQYQGQPWTGVVYG